MRLLVGSIVRENIVSHSDAATDSQLAIALVVIGNIPRIVHSY